MPPYYGVQSSTFKCGISTVKDYEGNVYNTVKIGNQCWLRENLKSTKLNDGTLIPNVTDYIAWTNITTFAYCWPNNDSTFGQGGLYNWYTVETGKLCPLGWHVPSYSEDSLLIAYLGGESVAGGKLKEVGTTHWASPNTGATNESGYTAIPTFFRNYFGMWRGNNATWWTTTLSGTIYHWVMRVGYNSAAAGIYIDDEACRANSGNTVRCLKD